MKETHNRLFQQLILSLILSLILFTVLQSFASTKAKQWPYRLKNNPNQLL